MTHTNGGTAMPESKTEAEQLEEELNKGYTGIFGLTVRNKEGQLEVTKLPNYLDRQPVSMMLDDEQISLIKQLSDFLEYKSKADNNDLKADWAATNILKATGGTNTSEFKVI